MPSRTGSSGSHCAGDRYSFARGRSPVSRIGTIAQLSLSYSDIQTNHYLLRTDQNYPLTFIDFALRNHYIDMLHGYPWPERITIGLSDTSDFASLFVHDCYNQYQPLSSWWMVGLITRYRLQNARAFGLIFVVSKSRCQFHRFLSLSQWFDHPTLPKKSHPILINKYMTSTTFELWAKLNLIQVLYRLWFAESAGRMWENVGCSVW
jgi:hypothetical protein